ncbi:MAG: cell division protein ZapA [Desulfobacterales bacterium]|nr:cell division protein ZapA [Desulfobacterales bacterium]
MDEIIKIELFGEEFQFKADAQVEDPQRIAEFLSGYIREAEEVIGDTPGDRNKIATLLLAAMNLSKDYKELKWRHALLQKDVKYNISSLMEKLNKGIELANNSIEK